MPHTPHPRSKTTAPYHPTARERMKPLQRPPGDLLPWVQLRNAHFHPSIYKKMIGAMDSKVKNGDLVSVYDRDGQMFGTALLSAQSAIGLRMLTFDATPFDEATIESRIAAALAMRRELLQLDNDASAYRLIHAEGDGLPGLIADRYDEHAVVELFSFPMYRRRDMIARVLTTFSPIKHVLFRSDERVQAAEGFALGAAAPAGPKQERSPDRKSTQITENGLRFQIDLTHGHKTGFFCDQRENRLALTHFTAGKDVLDLCSYSGGFAVYAAARGAAKSVTAVDLDEDAIALAQRNANLNKIPRGQFQTVHGDAFVYLRQMQQSARQCDVVVLDPPKLVAAREELEEGRMKYFDLNRLAMTVVKPGGILVTCSCSGLLSPEDFFGVLRGAARGARRRVQVFRTTGPSPDHPVMTDHPESAYLKCLWCRVW